MIQVRCMPGPWIAVPQDYYSNGALLGAWRVLDTAGNIVATGLTEDNAHLIAAAPELLAALQRCVRYIDGLDEAGYGSKLDNPCYIDAFTAIAKVQGA